MIIGLVLAAKAKGASARLAQLETLYQKLEILFENPRLTIKRHYFPILSWIRAKGSQRLPMDCLPDPFYPPLMFHPGPGQTD